MAIVGSLLLCGCATTTTTAVRPTQYPSTVKDWNGIDNVEFLQEFRLNNYAQLVVEPLDTSTTPLPPQNENTYQPVVEMLKKTDAIITSQIEREVGNELVVLNKQPEHPEKTLLVRGKVTEMNPGSRALRFWVSFGAGSAWVQIQGEIVDAQSGNVLLRFTQRNVGAMGVVGESYETVFTRCVEGLGRDIGRLIKRFKD